VNRACLILVTLAAVVPTIEAAVRVAGPEAGFAAVTSGPAAASWNPAHLAYFPDPRLELLGLSGGFGNSSFSMRDYGRYNGSTWDQGDKDEILAAIDGDGLRFRGTARAGAMGFSLPGFAFSTGTRAASSAAIPKPAIDLLLNGNTVGETFSLEGAEGEAIAFTEFRLSYARRIEDLVPALAERMVGWCVGASAKLYQGWAYGELLEATGGVTTTTDVITGGGQLVSVTAMGGRGYGLDLGLVGPLGADWTGSFSIRDLFGSIDWTSEAEERIDTFEVLDVSLGEGTEEVVVSESVTRPLDSHRTDLPVAYAVGVAHHGDRLLTAGTLEVATAERAGGFPTPRAALAAGWALSGRFALRGTASLGGPESAGVGVGAGFALGPVQLDLGISTWGSLNPFGSKGVYLVSGLGVGL